MMNLFTRNKKTNANELIFNTSEIKFKIAEWMAKGGLNFTNFSTILQLIGLKFPIKFTQWNEDRHSLKCLMLGEKESIITLANFDGNLEILVTYESESRRYLINKKNNNLLGVTLANRTVIKNGKKLYNFYCEYFCDRTVVLDNSHRLEIEMSEPYGGSFKVPNASVLKNADAIENYLLSLDTSLEIKNVYDELIKLLGFSRKEIMHSEKIVLSYIEQNNGKDLTRQKFYLKNGKLQKYLTSSFDKTLEVYIDGSWNYTSDNLVLKYNKEQDDYVFCVSGSEVYITNLQLSSVFATVKRKISELEIYF